ncbi:hypothetical protein NP233_g10478 [Leucocoprinus birnbaumii]|uniref:DUF6533 domain-containing protein n=1 Tax=Leucocoprinus birnbaumii TaxID=56174 RepID=A0AAD5VIE4_9AGAR|nr:hypothetical protein NP233_g10478 [Leucocoprinus birnbaumii]
MTGHFSPSPSSTEFMAAAEPIQLFISSEVLPRPEVDMSGHAEFQLPSAYQDKLEAFQTNCVAFASFTALVWDHIDTFVDEVEYIWKGEKGPFIYLFFFHSYRLYGHLRCANFVKYEGVTVSLAVEMVGLMMLVRIRAVYRDSNQLSITVFLAFLLLLETVINIWLIAHAGPVIHNPLSRETSCSIIYDQTTLSRRVLASSSAWIPLIYVTIVFYLTLRKTFPPLSGVHATYTFQHLFEDGLLYYSVIVIVTLILTVMLLTAPEGTRNILSQTEQLLTVAMMSRITLNLRKVADSPNQYLIQRTSLSDPPHNEGGHRQSFWFVRLLAAFFKVIKQLWERGSMFQPSYYDNHSEISSFHDSPVNIGGMNVVIPGSETRAERGEGVYKYDRVKRQSLGIWFTTRDSMSSC